MGQQRVFILGSGFSKAASESMPVVKELTEHLKTHEFLCEDPYYRLLDDPEILLSYLSWKQPWKRTYEVKKDASLFEQLQNDLGGYIEGCEDQAFKRTQMKEWMQLLIAYWHRNETTVISYNYDTVVERYARKINRDANVFGTMFSSFDLYRLPLTPVHVRVGESPTTLKASKRLFHLIKLHGSINWFYSGIEGFPGDQVYLRPVDTDSPLTDGMDERDPQYGRSKATFPRLLIDKIPLIIPPVTEKSRFYSNQTLRSLWWDAREALSCAEEIFCVGYSLPPTDLTTKMFFQSVANPRAVYVVNREASALKRRYSEVFPKAEINNDFSGEDAVKNMVEQLIGEESKRNEVTRHG